VPVLRAFEGISYTERARLRDLVCPPYDVITPEDQARLHARHPHNAVRVELPFSDPAATDGRYRKAGERFREWLATGVLGRDDTSSLYVYRQDYVSGDGVRRRVAGVIGALALEPLGAGSGILAHERTMPGPVEDRLALLRDCPVNISPIYAIYSGRGELGPYLDCLPQRPTRARFVDEGGTLHRLWAVHSPAEINMLSSVVGAGPLVIADGHHRYETALAYRRERGTAGEHDSVMCLCVDVESEEVQVLPYHRAFVAPAAGKDMAARLERCFSTRSVASGEGDEPLARSRAVHPLLFVFPERELLAEVSAEDVRDAVAGRPPEWHSLDVVALHEAVMPRVLPEGVERMSFTNDAARARALVRSGDCSGAVLLRALDAARVIAVARAGERMPQKASFFWPKALTGLVFRSLD
jgi:uncharacterized protein (DUF1015 family)